MATTLMRSHPTLACTLSLWCGCVLALDPALDVSQYGHTAWKIRDGFAKGYIEAFAQSREGYLWLGTDAGLMRFDGVRNVPWSAPAGTSLPDNHIRTLLVAKDGTLWIGTRGGLASWNRGKLIDYPRFAGYLIDALAEDGEGTTWVGLQSLTAKPGLLCSIRGSSVECAGDDGLFGRAVVSLNEASDGSLWVAAINGVWRWRPVPPKFYPLPDPIAGSLQILTTTSTGMVLVNTQVGILRVNNDKLERLPLPALPRKLQLTALFADRDGGVWIGPLGGGLLHLHDGRLDSFERSDGFSGDWISSIFEDREGNVWVATTEGLDRFRAIPAITYSARQGVRGFPAAVLAASDGGIWIGTGLGLNRWRDGHMLAYRARRAPINDFAPQGQVAELKEVIVRGLPEPAWPSMFEDRSGRIWFGGGPKAGLGYLEKDRFTLVKGIPNGYINSVAEDSGGNFWIANSEKGLFRVLPDLTAQPVRLSVGARTGDAWRIAVDPLKGGVWVGLFSGGVIYFAHGQVRASYSTKDGLGKGVVNDLRVAADGTVWAATDGGLSRIKDGHIATLTSKNGLPCDAIHSSIVDDAGSTWVYTACGLARIASSDLDAWAVAADQGEVTPTISMFVLSEADGVRSFSTGGTATPHLTKARDGRLWFTSPDGVTVVDPRHLLINSLPPPVHVEQVIADRMPYEPASQLKLPPLVRDLQIDYTALSFVAPEKNQFRYKLEGRDGDWQDAGNRRQAFYSDLDPGNYRFRVIAANNSGVWNEEGASLDFSIAPTYWQTNWFRAVCVLALIALLWGLYLLRVRYLARQFDMTLDARVGERTRIARELHDTLLQSFHGLLLRFQTASELLSTRPAEAKHALDGAIDLAAQAITEGRDAVQGLRASVVESNDLAVAIRTFGEELAAEQIGNGSTVLHVVVEGTPRILHPIVRDEIYRIACEALRNAFKHAVATHIEVELRYDERQLCLRVRDDGKGIDLQFLTEEGRAGHYGLHGMRERAKLMGGKLTVWSALDSGAEVELTVPATRAYATSASTWRSWFAKIFSRESVRSEP
jgi:signal transduction histidine kinase/ligand-binding sensor domain-containing protein